MNEPSKHPSARRELKEKIIEAAGLLFAEHGIKGITMDDIAASFGISKRTLYEVFADKRRCSSSASAAIWSRKTSI